PALGGGLSARAAPQASTTDRSSSDRVVRMIIIPPRNVRTMVLLVSRCARTARVILSQVPANNNSGPTWLSAGMAFRAALQPRARAAPARARAFVGGAGECQVLGRDAE